MYIIAIHMTPQKKCCILLLTFPAHCVLQHCSKSSSSSSWHHQRNTFSILPRTGSRAMLDGWGNKHVIHASNEMIQCVASPSLETSLPHKVEFSCLGHQAGTIYIYVSISSFCDEFSKKHLTVNPWLLQGGQFSAVVIRNIYQNKTSKSYT